MLSGPVELKHDALGARLLSWSWSCVRQCQRWGAGQLWNRDCVSPRGNLSQGQILPGGSITPISAYASRETEALGGAWALILSSGRGWAVWGVDGGSLARPLDEACLGEPQAHL